MRILKQVQKIMGLKEDDAERERLRKEVQSGQERLNTCRQVEGPRGSEASRGSGAGEEEGKKCEGVNGDNDIEGTQTEKIMKRTQNEESRGSRDDDAADGKISPKGKGLLLRWGAV